MQAPPLTAQFDHNDRRYRCCCDNCHAVTGTKIACAVQIVLVALSLVPVLLFDGYRHYYLSNAVPVLCCAVTLMGLFVHNKCCVLVGVIYHAIFMVAYIVLGAAAFVWFAVRLAKGHSSSPTQGIQKDFRPDVLLAAFALLFSGILFIWFFSANVAAYRYLEQVAKAGLYPLGHAEYGGTAAANHTVTWSAQPPPAATVVVQPYPATDPTSGTQLEGRQTADTTLSNGAVKLDEQ